VGPDGRPRGARATSFRLHTETIAGHDRAHLLQLDQTIAALQG
jgi:hypothetical protein